MTIGNYTVGFLDILGFKDLIQNKPLADLATLYESIIIEVGNMLNKPFPGKPSITSLFPNHKQGQEFCKRHIFSDSIILFSLDDTWESCIKLLLYVWRFMQITMGMRQFPLRAGVSYGEMYINEKSGTFLGKALTNAYLLEEDQQWIGGAIDPSVFAAHPIFIDLFKGDFNLLNDIFFEYEVPMETKPASKMRTFNWRWNLIVEQGTKWLFPPSIDEEVTKKQRNALKYAEKIRSTGRLYPTAQDRLFLELRAYWVGASEPPFKHGDEL